VIEALDKKAGPEDDRTEGKRFHDALQLACAPLPRYAYPWSGRRRHPSGHVYPARTTGEPRWLVVGRMGDKHWSAVVTYREDGIRIISVRRARDEEVRIYEV
jgi:hypothetical protein